MQAFKKDTFLFPSNSIYSSKAKCRKKGFLNVKSAIKVSRIVKMTLKSCTERISDIDKVNLAKLFNDGLVFGLSQFLQMPQKLHWIEKWSKLTSN